MHSLGKVGAVLYQKSVLHDIKTTGGPTLESDLRVRVKVGVGNTYSGNSGDVALFFVSRQVGLLLNGNKINMRRRIKSINVFD